MKKLSKVLSIVLALAMVMGLCACGSAATTTTTEAPAAAISEFNRISNISDTVIRALITKIEK